MRPPVAMPRSPQLEGILPVEKTRHQGTRGVLPVHVHGRAVHLPGCPVKGRPCGGPAWKLSAAAIASLVASSLAVSGTVSRILTTPDDFAVPGTQVGDVDPGSYLGESYCQGCHGYYSEEHSPHATWKGSLMAVAALDPLFHAQLAVANQDAPGVGAYCVRCHAPTSVISGRVSAGTSEALEDADFEGVSCLLCHSMVDPRYDAEASPPEDAETLGALATVPEHYGNAMFVLDRNLSRRGPRADHLAPHEMITSGFFRSGNLCGTCHDVGNVAVSLQPDGSYFYNAVGEPAPDDDPRAQFPLERTYTEWALSDFARLGVDMEGLFGGEGGGVVSTCQDCHMPRTTGSACSWGDQRSDLALHTFAGASAWVLEITALRYAGDARIDAEALERGRLAAIAMVERAATLEARQEGDAVRIRVTNQAGHKFPTGHIEGRRAWLSVRFLDAGGETVQEIGAYDFQEAQLEETGARVYEMSVGLSDAAAAATGLPPGVTGHMSLANTIEKDTRIPPRGYDPDAFASVGAPAVGIDYAPGQHWDEVDYAIPEGAAAAEAILYYQTATREYIEELRDNNHTNDTGDVLHSLWEATDRCPPIEVARARVELAEPRPEWWMLR